MPKQEFGYRPPLPNEGSPYQTPSTLLIDAHYAQLLLVERWTWDRFTRLCSFLRITPAELASAVMLPHRYIPRYVEDNRIPGPAARPVALLLTLLESHCCGKMTQDVIENPFPNLGNASRHQGS